MKHLRYIFLLFLTGCNTVSQNDIFERRPESEIAVLRDPKDLTSMPDIEYGLSTITEIEAKREMDIPIWKWGSALLTDKVYAKVKLSSFINFNKWFEKSTKQLWYKQIGEGYDCDNFAFLYKALFSVTTYKNNKPTEILVGVIFVKQKHEFGGVAGGDYLHALNIVGTESGWFVYEPQTGFYDRLEHYKNDIAWYLF
jgi:hypothetical protein